MVEPQKSSRVQDAYGRIKVEILANRMAPGVYMTEPEIAVQMGMSRTPVREALIQLQAEGLVELVPRRGARVVPIRAEDMREIYEILTALEPEAAASLAARTPSDTELAPLSEACTAMERALAAEDLDAWATADDAFHRALLTLHGNGRLTAMVVSLFDQAHRARMATLRLRRRPDASTKDHRDILEALRRGDSEAARVLFRTHRARAAEELLAILTTYRLPHL